MWEVKRKTQQRGMKSMIKCRLMWKEKGCMERVVNEMSDTEYTGKEWLKETHVRRRGRKGVVTKSSM
jgi:hypothetical protein